MSAFNWAAVSVPRRRLGDRVATGVIQLRSNAMRRSKGFVSHFLSHRRLTPAALLWVSVVFLVLETEAKASITDVDFSLYAYPLSTNANCMVRLEFDGTTPISGYISATFSDPLSPIPGVVYTGGNVNPTNGLSVPPTLSFAPDGEITMTPYFELTTQYRASTESATLIVVSGAWAADSVQLDNDYRSPLYPDANIPFPVTPDGDWIIYNPTPEPASLCVWALLGLVGVAYVRRRRAKA